MHKLVIGINSALNRTCTVQLLVHGPLVVLDALVWFVHILI